jgi:hypothetical protein
MARPDCRFWYECRVLRRRLPAAVAVAAVLAFPAVSLADSAGDNQYQDPFSNVPTQPKQQKKQSPSGTTTTPAPAPAPAASPAPSSTTAAPAAQDPSQTLPRTGFPLLPAAGLGAALIGAGLTLRRLVSDR